jgi:hypothetical protein
MASLLVEPGSGESPKLVASEAVLVYPHMLLRVRALFSAIQVFYEPPGQAPAEVLPRGAGSSGTAIASSLRRVRRLAIGDAANRLISSILGPLGPDRKVARRILTRFFTGNRERLAGVQGAAMSPLVAGTMPAKSGREAPGLSPSRRPGLVVSPGRSSPGRRGTCALECNLQS